MYFDNLTLAGWSYEKGDFEIPLTDQISDKRILSRNPVKSTYVYKNEGEWVESCLLYTSPSPRDS